MSEKFLVHRIQNHTKYKIRNIIKIKIDITTAVLIQNRSYFHYDMTMQRILTQNIIFGRTKD